MDRLSGRNGVKIGEPICRPGVKIPDLDWKHIEPREGGVTAVFGSLEFLHNYAQREAARPSAISVP